MKKRLSTVAMAAAICLSMGNTVYATAPTPSMGTAQDFNQNKANTEVNIQGMTDTDMDANLSATVPLNVKLAVMASGEVKGPTNYKITNTSLTKKVKVTNVQCAGENGYTTIGTPGANDVDLRTISLTADTDTFALANITAGTGHTPEENAWTMESATTGASDDSDEVGITFSGSIPDLSKLSGNATTAGGEKAFTLSYTIEKAN